MKLLIGFIIGFTLGVFAQQAAHESNVRELGRCQYAPLRGRRAG